MVPYCAIPRDYLSDTPLLRTVGFLVSQHGQVGAIPPAPFLSTSPLERMRSGGATSPPPPQNRYLSDTCAIPHENKANGCDTPFCDTISKRYCAIWGVSRTGPLRHPVKNFGQALRFLEKQALWRGHPARTSMTKLRSEKLRADFSFPNFFLGKKTINIRLWTPVKPISQFTATCEWALFWDDEAGRLLIDVPILASIFCCFLNLSSGMDM